MWLVIVMLEECNFSDPWEEKWLNKSNKYKID